MKSTFFQKYELPIFFILAYTLSWLSAPFANGGLLPHGPTLAAVLVIAFTTGKQGLREYWNCLTNFRAGWWYFIGPTIIAAYLLGAFVINVLMGATPVSPFPVPSVSTFIILLLMGGQWEEPGWTGYALPKFQEYFASPSYAILAAILTTGLFRAVWHLPLVLYGDIAWYDAAFFIFAFQIIIAWLYYKSNKSIPAVMVFHYVSNLLTGRVMLRAFTDDALETYYILFVIFACLAALVIVRQTKFKLGNTAL